MGRNSIKMGAVATIVASGLLFLGTWSASETRAQTASPPAAVAPLSGIWTIDPAHTNVNFAVRHNGISTVRGRFDAVTGAIAADAARPENSSVQVTIQAASIDTDVPMRDNHLRSADFFDVAQYPLIKFRSTRIEKAADGGFVAHGDLTMHGVTKEVALPFKVAGPIADKAGGRIGIETYTRLNRQDYGIKYHQVLDNGALAVANDIDITISLEAVPAKPAAAPAQ